MQNLNQNAQSVNLPNLSLSLPPGDACTHSLGFLGGLSPGVLWESPNNGAVWAWGPNHRRGGEVATPVLVWQAGGLLTVSALECPGCPFSPSLLACQFALPWSAVSLPGTSPCLGQGQREGGGGKGGRQHRQEMCDVCVWEQTQRAREECLKPKAASCMPKAQRQYGWMVAERDRGWGGGEALCLPALPGSG